MSLQAACGVVVLVFLSLHGEHSENGAHPHGDAPCLLTASQARHRVTGIRRQLDDLGRHPILSWNRPLNRSHEYSHWFVGREAPPLEVDSYEALRHRVLPLQGHHAVSSAVVCDLSHGTHCAKLSQLLHCSKVVRLNHTLLNCNE